MSRAIPRLRPTFPPRPGPSTRAHNGDGDAFVAKLNAAGSALDYATFLGGDDMDAVCGIAVDASGAAYVTGYRLLRFPHHARGLRHEPQRRLYEAFVAKLNAAGSALAYATFLGGSSDDRHGIAVDRAGRPM